MTSQGRYFDYRLFSHTMNKSPVFQQQADSLSHFHIAHPFPFYCICSNHQDCTDARYGIMKATRIETGTNEGDALGFFEDLFSGWLEIQDNRCLYLHYIISRHKNEGNTQALIRKWLSDGYDVRVVMPRPVMQHILGKFQFVPTREYFPDQYEDAVEVWYHPAWQGSEASCSRAHAGIL
jgi:hypothetical protein